MVNIKAAGCVRKSVSEVARRRTQMRTKMLGLAAIATLAVPAMTLPTAASAQPVARYLENPCGPAQKNARITGGAIGAVGGAALGRSLAARNARTEGTLLGALVGAAVGQEVGRRTGCRNAGYQQGYGYAPAYSPGYRTAARPPCKPVAGNRYVCLQPDGRWR
jgi:hypothetical protein